MPQISPIIQEISRGGLFVAPVEKVPLKVPLEVPLEVPLKVLGAAGWLQQRRAALCLQNLPTVLPTVFK